VEFVYGFKNGGERQKIDRAFTFIGSCGSCKKENKFRKKSVSRKQFQETLSRKEGWVKILFYKLEFFDRHFYCIYWYSLLEFL